MNVREKLERMSKKCSSLTAEEVGIILPFFILSLSLNKETPILGPMQTMNMQDLLNELYDIDPAAVESIGTISEKILAN